MEARGTGRVATIVAIDALDDADLEAWHRLRRANATFDSPYFHPEFARAVHESGPRVDVIIERDEEGVRSLFAGHRVGSVFRPVGWPGADFQGPIGRGDEPIDARRLVRAAGMRAMAFDHLLEIPGFEPWIESRRESPYVSVEGGLEAYLGRATKSGRDNMGQARRKANKAQAEHGELRFDAESTDANLLDAVIALKRARYVATGARDYFAAPGRIALLHRLLRTKVDGFAGVLSAVHVGPRLLAAHFGMRSGGVLHWWFPVYDPELASFSPGWVLLRELTAAAPELGLTRIDLGRGDDEYKRRAKTGQTIVCQGYVAESRVALATHRVETALHALASRSSLPRRIRRIVRKR
jgi:CelD/BcsL family acetyltransferase involved in cellulose biosynthesis